MDTTHLTQAEVMVEYSMWDAVQGYAEIQTAMELGAIREILGEIRDRMPVTATEPASTEPTTDAPVDTSTEPSEETQQLSS